MTGSVSYKHELPRLSGFTCLVYLGISILGFKLLNIRICGGYMMDGYSEIEGNLVISIDEVESIWGLWTD